MDIRVNNRRSELKPKRCDDQKHNDFEVGRKMTATRSDEELLEIMVYFTYYYKNPSDGKFWEVGLGIGFTVLEDIPLEFNEIEESRLGCVKKMVDTTWRSFVKFVVHHGIACGPPTLDDDSILEVSVDLINAWIALTTFGTIG